MYKQNKGLADKLFRYTSYAVLAASLGCGYVAANRLIASSTPRQTASLLNSENKSTPLQWNVRFTKEDKQKYCPGHEKRIRRLCWNDHKTVYCDGEGCQTRSSNSLETKIYTASSVQELNKKVHQDLKSRGIDERSFEATALIARKKDDLIYDRTAKVNIGCVVENLANGAYSSSSRLVTVETGQGVGLYAVSNVRKGQASPSKRLETVSNVSLPSSSSVDCLTDLAQSVACEASLATMEIMFEYAKGEEKISPVKPGFDFLKNVGVKTGKNLFERYSPEEVKALMDLMKYAKTAEEFYDAVGDKTNIVDLSLAIKAFGMEKVLDALEGKLVEPLDQQCESIAEQTKQSCSQAWTSIVKKRSGQTAAALQNIKNQDDLRNLPVQRDSVGGYKLNTQESVSDWFRSRGLPSDFAGRKPVYERTHPGEKYTGSKEQNGRWTRELNNQGNNSQSMTKPREQAQGQSRTSRQDASPSPIVRTHVGGHELNIGTSAADAHRATGGSGSFKDRKPDFERRNPGERFKGTAEQNDKHRRQMLGGK